MDCQCYNFSITRGCSFLVYLNIQNSDSSYVNLSGYSARGKVKAQPGDTGYIYDLNPQIIEPKISGLLMFSGSAYSTSGLACGQFLYDAEIYIGDYALKVLNGDFIVYSSTSY